VYSIDLIDYCALHILDSLGNLYLFLKALLQHLNS